MDRAGVLAPPPLIFLSFLGLGMVLTHFIPLSLYSWLQPLGVFFIIVGFFPVVAAVRAMRGIRTNVSPYKPTMAVISTGVYRFTRNPIYLSFTTIYLGIMFLVNSAWLLVLFPALILVMDVGVIFREERYLESKFGEAYTRYKRKVRRWL